MSNHTASAGGMSSPGGPTRRRPRQGAGHRSGGTAPSALAATAAAAPSSVRSALLLLVIATICAYTHNLLPVSSPALFVDASSIKWTPGHDQEAASSSNGGKPDARTAPRSQKYWDEHGVERPDYAKTDDEIARERGEAGGSSGRSILFLLAVGVGIIAYRIHTGQMIAPWESGSHRLGRAGSGGEGGGSIGGGISSILGGGGGGGGGGRSAEEARNARLARFERQQAEAEKTL